MPLPGGQRARHDAGDGERAALGAQVEDDRQRVDADREARQQRRRDQRGHMRRPQHRGVALHAGQLPRPPQHRLDHRRGQLAGERVLLARVEAAEHGVPARRGPRRRARTSAAAAAPTMSHANWPRQTITRASGSSASSRSSHSAQLSRSDGSGLLAGGAQRTAAVMKQSVSAQPVVAVDRRRLVREPGGVQGGEQEVARPVAGEHRGRCGSRRARPAPARAAPRARPGRRSPATGRPQYSQSRNAARFSRRHLLAPRDEPRAAAALDDLALERREGAHGALAGGHQPEAEPLDDRLELADVAGHARADLARGELDHRADDRERVVGGAAAAAWRRGSASAR